MDIKEFLDANLFQKNIMLIPSVILDGDIEVKENYQSEKLANGIRLYTQNDTFSDEFFIKLLDNGMTVRRAFKNTAKGKLKVKELKVAIDGIDFGKNPKDDYFYSIENPRIYETYTFPIDYVRTEADAMNSEFDVVANNRWSDPGVVSERINNSPYQPFPAILIGNYKSNVGLVHGTLSQKVFYHNYIVKHSSTGVQLNVLSSFKAIDYLEVESGRTLVDEWYFGKTEHADDYNKIFDGYTTVLREKLPVLYGASAINRHSLVWGSWNDGIYRNVSHDMLLKEAAAVKKYFPAVEWFQLDDGYAVHIKVEKESIAHGLGVPYENDGIDYEKFPYGLKGFTDEIRKIGLRPGLWIGGACSIKSKIYREHPEWFSDYSLRMTKRHPLDTSIPEAREYMTSALDKLILDYGFDAVKHDFWSYPYEESSRLYKNQDKSGYEYRRWWTQELRKRLPTDGYLQTGCDIVLGNPFLGEDFTNYRYGIDVGSGNWDHIKTTILWGCACFATHTGDLFVPNSDAIGLLDGLSDDDFLLWVNFVMITHSMVELSGRYAKEEINQKRLKILQKATCNINNGQDVYFLEFDYRKKGNQIPEIMYCLTPFFSTESGKNFMPIRTVAVFNFSEQEKEFAISPGDMAVNEKDFIFTDIWSGEQIKVSDCLKITLKPHESKLYAINLVRKYAIYDTTFKVCNAKQYGNIIAFDMQRNENAEMLVSGKIKSVKINGKESAFAYCENKLTFQCATDATVKILFDK